MIIAIDGPSASGKGTLAKRLAAEYGLRHLDTGALYRAVALTLLRAGAEPSEAEAADAARRLNLEQLAESALRSPEVGRLTPLVAAMPAVRAALIDVQRDVCRQGRAVLDGRDIGTVIYPEAPVKFYVSAAPEVRALRRLQEHQARGEAITFEEVLHDLAERDARDAVRSHPAADAHLLDTSGLTIEQVLAAARRIVEAAFGARGV